MDNEQNQVLQTPGSPLGNPQQIEIATVTQGRNPQDQEYFEASRKQVEGRLLTSHETGLLRAYDMEEKPEPQTQQDPQLQPEPDYYKKQAELVNQMGAAVKNYDEEGKIAAQNEYNANLDVKNQDLYQQHRVEAGELNALQTKIDQEKNRLRIAIENEKENEIDVKEFLMLLGQKGTLKEKLNSSQVLNEASEIYKEDNNALREMALKEMYAAIPRNQELEAQETQQEQSPEQEIILGPERIVGETPTTPEEEITPEEKRRRKNITKIYKLIAGVAGGLGGAAVGGAAVSSSIFWFPVVVAGAIALPGVGNKLSEVVLGKIFNQRGYDQLEKAIAEAGDNEARRQSLQTELQKRRNLHNNLKEAAGTFFKSGRLGLLIGGITGVATTLISGAEFGGAGGTEVAEAGFKGTEIGDTGIGGTEVTEIGDTGLGGTEANIGETLLHTPDTVNVYDFAGGNDPSYVEYIKGLQSEGKLLGENLLLTDNLGSTIGEAQGELLRALHQQGVPTNQINGKAFMDQVIEINKALINNRPFNLQNMVEMVKNASLGAT